MDGETQALGSLHSSFLPPMRGLPNTLPSSAVTNGSLQTQGTHLRPSTLGFIGAWSCESSAPQKMPGMCQISQLPGVPHKPHYCTYSPGAGSTVMNRGNVMLAEGTYTSPLPSCHLRANLASGSSTKLSPQACQLLFSLQFICGF